MLRRRWDIMNTLHEVPEPTGGTHQAYAEKIGRHILDTYPETVDHKATVAATATGSILIDLERDDELVVTPEDVQSAAERTASDFKELTYPEVVREVRSWLSYVGLEEVDTEFSTEWTHWETIWIAPIFPTLHAITEFFENPLAVSLPAIREAVDTEFSNLDQTASDDFGARELNDTELDAFLTRYRSELADTWASIDDTDNLVWVNPARVDETLRGEGTVLSLEEVNTAIAGALSEAAHVDSELIPAEIGAGNIGPVMNTLQDSFGWHRLGTASEISWYLDADEFEADYREHAVAAQEIYNDKSNASMAELHTARAFFQHNQDVIVERENAPQAQLEQYVEKLSHTINANKQWERLDTATPGDNLSSNVENLRPSEYHVAVEFEEKLERLRDDDEEDEEEDKGLSGFRY